MCVRKRVCVSKSNNKNTQVDNSFGSQAILLFVAVVVVVVVPADVSFQRVWQQNFNFLLSFIFLNFISKFSTSLH